MNTAREEYRQAYRLMRIAHNLTTEKATFKGSFSGCARGLGWDVRVNAHFNAYSSFNEARFPTPFTLQLHKQYHQVTDRMRRFAYKHYSKTGLLSKV